MSRYLLLPVFVLLSLAFVLHHDQQIKGCVTDASGEGLIGASIMLKDGDRATVTDLDGCFTLSDLPAPPFVLVVSYTGYAPKEITVREMVEELSIRLTEAATVSEVVVVSGLASRKSTEKARRKKNRVTTPASISDRLRGKEAGVRMDEAEARNLRVRGVSGEVASVPARSSMMTMAVDDGRDISGFSGTGVSLRKAAGQLTAGEVSDFAKWEMWSDIAQEDLARHREEWQMYPDRRYTLQLTNAVGGPLVDAIVVLQDAAGQTHWQSRTDNTGKAELWADMYHNPSGASAQWQIVAQYDGQTYRVDQTKAFHEGVNFLQLPVTCQQRSEVDIAFVVDATGSMGDEISYLQAELMNVIERIQDTLTQSELRTASVFYRDVEDEYLTRQQDFSRDAAHTLAFIDQQEADGGGDTPEAVEVALTVALEQLSWREEAAARLLFLVLDAPPHQQDSVLQRLHDLSKMAAAKGIRIIPLTGSGIDKSTEYLMRSLALATNGTYTFLTDHSGIGGKHIEPSTDAYQVEKLNDLLVRLCVQFGESPDCTPVYALQSTQDTVRIDLPQQQVNANPQSWRFFPNPSAGPVNLSFSDQGDGILYLADSNGKLLQRISQPGKGRQLDFSAYPSGQYVLIYEDAAGNSSSGRLVMVRS